MCGRYTYVDPYRVAEAMKRDFGVVIESEIPRYNVAPSQMIPVIRGETTGGFAVARMKWGLVPFWEKSPKPKLTPINARSEEAFGKPMFRQALQRRRAVLPCDGFFEWKPEAVGVKTPFHIKLVGGAPFVIAGMFEEAYELRPNPTCALLTVGPNELMAPIHNRMPVILDAEAAREWLKPGLISAEAMAALCRPYPAERMVAYPVSTIVNNVRNNVPECVVPLN
jgi:putative SOS response-associated peptidase YedK